MLAVNLEVIRKNKILFFLSRSSHVRKGRVIYKYIIKIKEVIA
jgi:hypothetical protein